MSRDRRVQSSFEKYPCLQGRRIYASRRPETRLSKGGNPIKESRGHTGGATSQETAEEAVLNEVSRQIDSRDVVPGDLTSWDQSTVLGTRGGLMSRANPPSPFKNETIH